MADHKKAMDLCALVPPTGDCYIDGSEGLTAFGCSLADIRNLAECYRALVSEREAMIESASHWCLGWDPDRGWVGVLPA